MAYPPPSGDEANYWHKVASIKGRMKVGRQAHINLVAEIGITPANLFDTMLNQQGKSDLERSYPRKMTEWREPGVRFIILRDNDGADCLALKQRLVSKVPDNAPGYLVRIVCQQLEGWLLGDMDAVAAAYPAAARHQSFRKLSKSDPDSLTNASELIWQLTDTQAKINRASMIAKHMQPTTNRSISFRVFVNGINRFLAE